MKKMFAAACALILILSLFSNVGAQSTSATGSVVNEKVWSVLSDATSTAQVIVTFKEEERANSEQLGFLEEIGITSAVVMNSLPIVGVVATKQQIEKLGASPEVLSIYLNEELSFYNAESTDVTGVDKVRTDNSFREKNGGMPVSGKGVGVVVNDSGVDGTHKDHELGRNLVQNVLGSTNLQSITGILPISYTENVPNTDTNSGHGTHVAGTVGGTGAMSGGKYEGAAPGASLIGYGSGGALFVLDGIGGFDYAITHQQEYDIRVITNSWGSSGDFDPNHPINIASKKAYDRGIVVLFAAGNEGPSENTHNPYAKAPWVISVAAGVKDGTLADFSSRGTKGEGGSFTMDGKEWTWEDRPTVTAPGVDIISTKVVSPLTALAAEKDAALIEPAHLPYYTTMSGTSMATPHVAGIVALMLEANHSLSPDEVKNLLQATATNMPGYETWEVGAGYVNAYAAVDASFNDKNYGSTLTMNQIYHSDVETTTSREEFEMESSLLTDGGYEFAVEEGLTSLLARVDGKGLMEETGNPINLVLIAPDGTEYSSGVSLLFPLYTDRVVLVDNPLPGTWKAEIRGLRGNELNPIGISLPENVKGTLSFTKINGFTGLNDIAGHPAEAAIQQGVKERLFDGYKDGTFKPDSKLTRMDMAKSLLMGAEIRQSLPSEASFGDVSKADLPFAEAVVAKGAAFRDQSHELKGVMQPTASGKFSPKSTVTKAELAYTLVQGLGLEKEAMAHEGDVKVNYKDERIVLKDQVNIPDALKGYVQVALDLNILNANFSVTQGKYDLKPKVEATFAPDEVVTRGDFAVAFTRYYQVYFN
ncbi:S8 family serine peptidase [Bacillus tianshenii]|uniref:S8 family peptidase n=1 Tax=Sutcliffiella tianshenii TaxID=1463404 RepID=UPI001CD4663C|nr:S8 family serine peptidase [Bacillus tianshenii]MCA1319184.1 S8 family serine peptidase [Bacillus tianshenii]